jgi:DNA-binding response OmpR family regulator
MNNMEKTTTEKYKIAVIEDEAVVSTSIADELKDAGFGVVTAFDGEAGLRLVLEEKPDLVLLDIVMPKMDGMTMLTKLRGSGGVGKHMPIILLTNLNADDKIMAGIALNEPAYYLVKSNYTLADVVAKVRDCLEKAFPK